MRIRASLVLGSLSMCVRVAQLANIPRNLHRDKTSTKTMRSERKGLMFACTQLHCRSTVLDRQVLPHSPWQRTVIVQLQLQLQLQASLIPHDYGG